MSIELVAPAGNMEKLRLAFSYGADACYLGGRVFGLRKYADNFTEAELIQARNLAEKENKKIYIVLNGFAHNSDLVEIEEHLKFLEKLQPSALIISDWGVFSLAKKNTTIPIHVSTQANVTNGFEAARWAKAGAKRIVLARELSLAESKNIADEANIEIELFIHGAMCASYSGRCIISNYSAGRDSNRGGCVQSCRHAYQLDELSKTSHIMNAKDLMGLSLIPQFIKSKVTAVKIEGRMKSPLYLANCCAAYRNAIDNYGEQNSEQRQQLEKKLERVSNRTFSTGGLKQTPKEDSINYAFSHYVKSMEYIGTIKKITKGEAAYLEVKSPFKINDKLFLFSAKQDEDVVSFQQLFDHNDQGIEKANPNMVIKLPWIKNWKIGDILSRSLEGQR